MNGWSRKLARRCHVSLLPPYHLTCMYAILNSSWDIDSSIQYDTDPEVSYASGQKIRTQTTLVLLQSRVENGITIHYLGEFNKRARFKHLNALNCAVIKYKIDIIAANVEIEIYLY